LTEVRVNSVFSDQPYGTWFHGQVDMFYFRSGKEALPAWLPFWGEKTLLLMP
jgi:signal peptidase II